MMMRSFLFTIGFVLVISNAVSQHYWDGQGNDGKWSNPLNWTGDSLPGQASIIVLNNEFVDSSYSIEVDSLAGSVVTGSVEIFPSSNRQIKLIIPSTNKLIPALSFSRPNSLVIRNGGILINSSGASTGTVIILRDSAYIFNGGKYIHNTPRAHASFVNLLSRSTGTEEGVFEFDVPSASSTVSMSDRVFGKLIFSSRSAGGISNYTASGTRKVIVRSDLEIIQGAKLNLNFTDTITISRDLLQEKSVLNISSGSRFLVLKVSGNLNIDSTSIITETGTASGKLLIENSTVQFLDIRGRIQENVSVAINNQQGVELKYPLQVETTLELKRGKLITDNLNPLVISNSGSLIADSLLQDTFIDGPIIFNYNTPRMHTLIPVGRSGLLRWMALKNWAGQIKAEFFKADPNSLSTRILGVHHIASHGYWKLEAFDTVIIQGVELSFPDPNFSGVTDLPNLSIAQLVNDEWLGSEIIERKGSPGSNGSVVCGPPELNSENFFTLASLVAGQNPLPVNYARIRIPLRTGAERKIEIKKVYNHNNFLSVEIESGINSKVEFVVFNETGQLFYKQKINVTKGNQKLLISLPLHSPGIYHIFGLFWGLKTNTVSFKS